MDAVLKLKNRIEKGLHICVGLDSDLSKIPAHLLESDNPILEFNKRIIDATKAFAAAYKFNFAFYEAMGEAGIATMRETLDYMPDEILSIADAKRGDIGNTCLKYAHAVFDELNFDSVTLAPYMGYDSIEPFLNYKNKIHFILGLTSNKSSIDFEKIKLENGKYLYQSVIEKINVWNKYGNLGVVFGATNIGELNENIDSMKNLFVLLPGVGAQGGSLRDVSKAFKSNRMNNFIVNISRGIIYCDSSINFESRVRAKIVGLQDELS